MTRSELIQAIAERFPQLNKTDCDIAVAEILKSICSALSRGDRIEIRGFGSLALNYRPPRTGRTQKQARKYLFLENTYHFKAGKELRELIDLPPKHHPEN